MAHNDSQQQLEQATRTRLARLANVPVDASRLERRLALALSSSPSGRSGRWTFPLRWRTISGLAAGIALAALLGLLLLSTDAQPVIAAPTELARLHREILQNRSAITSVTNYDQARQTIETAWPQAPSIPRPTVGQITFCCLNVLQKRRVACVVLEYKEQSVTMLVSRSQDLVCSAEHQTIQRDGRIYFTHTSDGLQMVMIQRASQWVCLMGDLAIDDLVDLADGLRF